MLFREHVYFLCVLPQLGNKQSPSIWKTLLRRGTENGEQGTSTEKDKWKIKSKVNKANLNSSAISKFLYYALFCSHLSFPVSRVTFPSKITTSKFRKKYFRNWESNWMSACNLAFPVFISPIVWNMCENLNYESVCFKELHKDQEYYWRTICRAGAAVVSTITSYIP